MRFAVWLLATGCTFSPGQPGGGSAAVDSAIGPDVPVVVDAQPTADAPTPPPDAPGCPGGFSAILGAPAGSTYKVMTAPATYDAAVAACEGLGSRVHLLEVDTQAEADLLEIAIDLTYSGSDTHLYRVLGKRPNTSSTTWSRPDGSALSFFAWGQGEPTNQSGELCIVIRKESMNGLAPRVMGAEQCSGNHEYACECE